MLFYKRQMQSSNNSSANAKQRLMRDLKVIQKQEGGGITACPIDDNVYKWEAMIEGPQGTVWQSGLFLLKMDFPQTYPNQPPKVVFVSQIYHPNVYTDGRICLDILDKEWKSVYDIWGILTSLRSLLCDPNPNSPANGEAAKLFKQNRQQYEKRVRKMVEKTLE